MSAKIDKRFNLDEMNVSRADLYEIVITVTRILVQRSQSLHRVCDSAWRSRLCTLSRKGLLKKLRFLINHADLRTIVKCFNRGIFADDPGIICIVYDEIVLRGLHNTVYVEGIVRQYKRYYRK